MCHFSLTQHDSEIDLIMIADRDLHVRVLRAFFINYFHLLRNNNEDF